MKRVVTLTKDLTHHSIPDMLTLGRAVYDGSIYNSPAPSSFVNPPVNAADLHTQIDDLRDKYDAARGGDAIRMAEQRQARMQLLQTLHKLANYAAPIVYNQKDEIERTGYAPSAGQRLLKALPVQIAGIKLTPLPGGSLRLLLPVTANAKSFTVILIPGSARVAPELHGHHLMLPSMSADAAIYTSASRKMLVSELTRHTPYDVYAFATGTAGNSILSQRLEVTTQ